MTGYETRKGSGDIEELGSRDFYDVDSCFEPYIRPDYVNFDGFKIFLCDMNMLDSAILFDSDISYRFSSSSESTSVTLLREMKVFWTGWRLFSKTFLT